jgi:hypothetical protein
MHLARGRRATGAVVLTLLLAACGCGGGTTAPKAAGDLSDEQKQQIRELNEQRSSEWGPPKKK